MRFIQNIGHSTLQFFALIGRFVIFTFYGVAAILKRPFYFRQFFAQLFRIGWLSLPVVGLTCLFTGAVLALQIYTGGSRFNAEQIVPSIVLIGILRELGPVLCGLMVAGRVSAAIAAELGTMRVTEQIDALTMLSANPIKYLIAPRLLAGVISLPLLVLVGDIIAVAGGWAVSTERLGFNPVIYLQNTLQSFVWEDLNSGLIKAAFFGFVISLSGCYHGFHSTGGAQGVGRATTNAVVLASILILALNYILTETFFAGA